MRTDTLFYRLFQDRPALVFELWMAMGSALGFMALSRSPRIF
jgi:predicted transposase YdaD